MKKGLLEQNSSLVYWFIKWVNQEILLCNLLLVKCSQALIEYLTKKIFTM